LDALQVDEALAERFNYDPMSQHIVVQLHLIILSSLMSIYRPTQGNRACYVQTGA
jgi:hypothetical protein